MTDVDTIPKSHNTVPAPSHLAAMTQARNAYRATLILAAAIVPTAPVYILLGLVSGIWQISLLGLVVAGLSVCVVAGVRMCRRGDSRRGIRLTLGALAITLVINSMLIAQFGLVSGLLVVILTIMIGVQALPAEEVPRLVIWSGALSLIAGLIDLLAPPWQYVIPGLSTFILTVIGVVLLVYGILIIRQFKSYPLLSKLIFVFLAVSLIPLALLGLVNYRSVTGALTREAQQTLSARATQVAIRIDEFMRAQLDTVRTAAHSPILAHADAPNRAEVTAFLQALQHKGGARVVSFALLDRNGRIRATTHAAESDTLRIDHDDFRIPFEHRRPYSSSVEFTENGDAVLYFSSPVVNENEQPIGVLRLTVQADILDDILDQSHVSAGQRVTTVLFDKDRVLALNNRADESPSELLDLKHDLANNTQSFFTTDLIPDRDSPADTYFAVSTQLETQAWQLVFAQPQSIFLYSAEEYVRDILLIVLTISGVVGVTAAYSAQLLVGPLTRLTRTAVRVSEGDLGARTDVESADEIGALAAAFNDMTQRLQQNMQGLAQHVEELRQTHAQLKAYSVELERSNRDLQSFASIASHDLNEPLRKIKSFSERLAAHHNAQLSPQARDYLLRIQSAVLRMQMLIDNLLTYSRVTITDEVFRPVDLSQIVRGVLSDLEIRIEQSGARVQVGDLPTLYANPTQMRQLMQNLISNALKFHRSDVPPDVRVNSVFTPVNGHADVRVDVFQISVTDNGIGIEEKYLDHIFHLFERLHPRGEYEGTGIGLAICRRIVKLHDGAIAVQSTPGQGSVFIVTLPAYHANGSSSASSSDAT